MFQLHIRDPPLEQRVLAWLALSPSENESQVYQTGDLANMDGLPEETKRLLPSLFSIRDGLYSLEFRKLVQSLTGSGPLSGEQIDLSVNAFGHTGHLLCHDDVIGTRKVGTVMSPL